MDDQPDVRVRDGARNLEEELQAGANRQPLGRDVLVDRAPATYSSARYGWPSAAMPAS